MPKKHAVSNAIKEAKFFKALVDNGGNAKEAYKVTVPQVKSNSAATLGSRELSKVDVRDVAVLYEKIGCDKYTVLSGLWARMKNDRVKYDIGTKILSKIAGWETKSNGLRDLLDRDLDLIEVVKVRLRKRSNVNDLRQVIDVETTLPTDKTIQPATEHGNSDEQGK